jgi:hypothetical protein
MEHSNPWRAAKPHVMLTFIALQLCVCCSVLTACRELAIKSCHEWVCAASAPGPAGIDAGTDVVLDLPGQFSQASKAYASIDTALAS